VKDLVISVGYVHCLTAFVMSMTVFGSGGTLMANVFRMHSKASFARFAAPFYGYRVSFIASALWASAHYFVLLLTLTILVIYLGHRPGELAVFFYIFAGLLYGFLRYVSVLSAYGENKEHYDSKEYGQDHADVNEGVTRSPGSEELGRPLQEHNDQHTDNQCDKGCPYERVVTQIVRIIEENGNDHDISD